MNKMTLFLAIFMAMLLPASAGAASNYEALGGYSVWCDNVPIQAGTDREVTLKVTNPAMMRNAFQVDVTFPAGVEPVLLDNQNYCEGVNGVNVVSGYSVTRRTLRILATNSSGWNAGVGLAFAKIKVHADNGFNQEKSMNFSNMVFMLTDSEVGYLGNQSTSTLFPFTPITSLSFETNALYMYAGETRALNAVFTPSNASVKSLSWKSSNTAVASVSQDGIVVAQATGTATITATTTDGTGLSASCQVNVMPDCYMMADTVKYIRGVENTIVELAVQLKNRMPLSALQFDLTLPGDVSMVMQDGYADVWLDAGRKSRNHTVEVEKQSSNKYRVLVSSPTSNALKGNDGALVYLHLSTNRYGTAGLFNFNFTNSIMATPDEVQYTQSNWNSPLSYEYVVGDADANVVVDVADYVVTANRILNRSTTRYFSDAANVNNDGSVNVTDLVGITNIALGKRPTETRRMPAMSHTAPSLSATVQAQPDGNQVLFSLDNEWAAAGMQMDVTLPAGVTVLKAELLGRAAGQQVDLATLADGRVRVLVSSFSASDIAAGGDAILALTLDGSQGGMMTVDDIVVAERDLTTHELAPLSVTLSTTGVSDLVASAGVRIWAESGSVVIESDEAGMAQLVMLNGMTQPLQVQPGRNTYPVAPGYYIVRLAGHTAKLKL